MLRQALAVTYLDSISTAPTGGLTHGHAMCCMAAHPAITGANRACCRARRRVRQCRLRWRGCRSIATLRGRARTSATATTALRHDTNGPIAATASSAWEPDDRASDSHSRTPPQDQAQSGCACGAPALSANQGGPSQLATSPIAEARRARRRSVTLPLLRRLREAPGSRCDQRRPARSNPSTPTHE